MALYHITLKSDKRHKNGAKETVKAVEHIEYINREGKYKDIDDKEKLRNLDNTIAVDGLSRISHLLYGAPHLLYKSPYGSIYNSKKGIAVTNNPSIDTISIAIMLAKESSHHAPLKLTGSNHFKSKCAITAAQSNLDVTFADASIQQKYLIEKEKIEHERRDFTAKGGKIILYKNLHQPCINSNFDNIAKASTIRTIPTMHKLPKRNVVSYGQNDASLLVQSNEHGELGFAKQESTPPVRWDLSNGRRIRATRTAKAILDVIEQHKDQIFAESHIEYINREKAFAQKGGCIYTEYKLPKWANDSPNEFFKAADRYSPKNSCRYKEIEFALPNEFSMEQNLELIHRFIAENLPNNYYNFAIHDKVGAMADGNTHNTHVHITFSPRIIDEAEKAHERSRTYYFRYPLRENAVDQSEKNQRKHGAPIDRKWSKKYTVSAIRESYANIQNELLEKYGFVERVDHRSLEAQRKVALMNGDTYLAALLNRVPETHISQKCFMEEKNPEVEDVKAYRDVKKRFQEELYRSHVLRQKLLENEELTKTDEMREHLNAVTQSIEYNNLDENSSALFKELQDNFLKALAGYEDAASKIITTEDAEEQARREYMSDDEWNTYNQYDGLQKEINNWKTIQEMTKITDEDDSTSRTSKQELLSFLDKKISLNQYKKEILKPKINEIDSRLDKSEVNSRIKNRAQSIIFANKRNQLELKKQRQNLQVALFSLEQAIFDERNCENNMPEWTDRELYNIIKRRYYGYKKELNKVKWQVAAAQKEVISLSRARLIAIDVILKHKMKAHRDNQRKLEKSEASLEKNYLIPYKDAALVLKELEKSAIDKKSDTYLQQLKTTQELQSKYQEKKNAIEKFKNDIDATGKELEKELALPENQQKLGEIALGVIAKNAPALRKFEKMSARHKELSAKVEELYKQMTALQQSLKGRNHFRYKVNKPAIPNLEPPEVAADAIAGNEKYATVTARVNEKDDTKNWALMSNLAKDEESSKRVYLDL